MMSPTRVLAGLVLLLMPALVAADVVELPALRDNTLYETSDGSLSNGAGQHFFAGETLALETRRGVIAFDIAGNIPAGATIESVSLTLFMSRTIAGDTPVSLHRLLADWGEGTSDAGGQEGGGAPSTTGDATWIHTFFPDQFWANPGGDFDPTPSATTTVGGIGSYVWSSDAMRDDVQMWLDDPASNFGWLVMGDENTVPSAKRFDSRENPLPERRPLLTVTYSLPVAGDFDGDGDVDIADFAFFASCFTGSGVPCAGDCCRADLDGDGDVDIADFSTFSTNFTGSQ